MESSRMFNIKRNIIGELVLRIISMFLPFVSRSIIIYVLGALFLGINSLYASIFTILLLAEMGFGSAMVFSMYEPIAKGNDVEVCALLNLYKKIYRIIGLTILVLGLLAMSFLPYIIKGDVPDGINIYVLYLIYLGSTVISYFAYAYKESLLIANQRSDINSKIGVVLTLLLNAVQIVALLLTKNYYVYCLIGPVFTIIRNLYVNHITKKMYPQYFCKGSISKSKKQDIKKRVTGLFIYKVCYAMRDSIDSITISAFLGLVVLAKFNNYFYITTTITGFLAIVKSSISASVGNSMVLETERKNYDDFKKCQLLYMMISTWCTVCIYCLVQSFINAWVGEAYMLDNFVAFLFAALFYCYKMGDICAVYRQAAGLWWQDRYRPIVESITNLVLNIILIQIIGVSGVLLSTIFCLIFINSIWASRILFRNFFTSMRQFEYIWRIAFFGIVTLGCMFVVSLITNFVVTESPILQFILRAAICLVIPWGVILPLYSILPEFKSSVQLLQNVIRKKV